VTREHLANEPPATVKWPELLQPIQQQFHSPKSRAAWATEEDWTWA
jgi:hypothetical protein